MRNCISLNFFYPIVKVQSMSERRSFERRSERRSFSRERKVSTAQFFKKERNPSYYAYYCI